MSSKDRKGSNMEGVSSKQDKKNAVQSRTRWKKTIGPKSKQAYLTSLEVKKIENQGGAQQDNETLSTGCSVESNSHETSVDIKQDYTKLVTPCFVKVDTNEVSNYLKAVERQREASNVDSKESGSSLNCSSVNHSASSLDIGGDQTSVNDSSLCQEVKNTDSLPRHKKCGKKRKINSVSQTYAKKLSPNDNIIPKRKRGRPKKINVELTNQVETLSECPKNSETSKIESNSETFKIEPNSETSKIEPIPEIEPGSETSKIEPNSETSKIEPVSEIEPSSETSKIEPNSETSKIEPISEIEPSSETSKIEPNSESRIIKPKSKSRKRGLKSKSCKIGLKSKNAKVQSNSKSSKIAEVSKNEPDSVSSNIELNSKSPVIEPKSESSLIEPKSENNIIESNSESPKIDFILKEEPQSESSKIGSSSKKSLKATKKNKKSCPPPPKIKKQKCEEDPPLSLEKSPFVEYTCFGLLSLHNMRPRSQVSYNVTSRRNSRESQCKSLTNQTVKEQYMECKICKYIYTSEAVLEVHVKSHSENLKTLKNNREINYLDFFNHINDITGKESMLIIKPETDITNEAISHSSTSGESKENDVVDSDSNSEFEGYTDSEINFSKLNKNNVHSYVCVICEEEFNCKNSIKTHIANHTIELDSDDDNNYYLETVNSVPINCYISIGDAFSKCNVKIEDENVVDSVTNTCDEQSCKDAHPIDVSCETIVNSNVISDAVVTQNVECNVNLNSQENKLPKLLCNSESNSEIPLLVNEELGESVSKVDTKLCPSSLESVNESNLVEVISPEIESNVKESPDHKIYDTSMESEPNPIVNLEHNLIPPKLNIEVSPELISDFVNVVSSTPIKKVDVKNIHTISNDVSEFESNVSAQVNNILPLKCSTISDDKCNLSSEISDNIEIKDNATNSESNDLDSSVQVMMNQSPIKSDSKCIMTPETSDNVVISEQGASKNKVKPNTEADALISTTSSVNCDSKSPEKSVLSANSEQVQSDIKTEEVKQTNKYIPLIKPFEIRVIKLENTPEIKLLKSETKKPTGRPKRYKKSTNFKISTIANDVQSGTQAAVKARVENETESEFNGVEKETVESVKQVVLPSPSNTIEELSSKIQGTSSEPQRTESPIPSTSRDEAIPSTSQNQPNSTPTKLKRKLTPAVKINYKRRRGKLMKIKPKPKTPIKSLIKKSDTPKIKKPKPDYNFMPLPLKLKRESKPKIKLEVSLHAQQKYDEIFELVDEKKVANPTKNPSKRKQSFCPRNLPGDYVKSLQNHFEKSLDNVPKNSTSAIDSDPHIKCHLCDSWLLKEQLQTHVTSVHLKANFTLFTKPKKKPDPSKPIQNEMVSVFNSQNSNFKLLNSNEVQENIDPTKNCKFTCKICSVSFNTIEKLGEHLISIHNIHENDEFSSLQCDQCTEIFENEELLNEHVIVVHDSEEHSKLVCSQCSQCFDMEEQLDLHVLNLHSMVSILPYHCVQCGQGFELKEQLKEHEENVHEAFKILPLCKNCYLCKKSSEIINIDCARYKAIKEREEEEAEDVEDDDNKNVYDVELENIVPRSFESCDHLKEFVLSSGLEERMQHLHFYQCENCGTVLVGKDVYNEHIKIHKQDLNKKFKAMVSKSKSKKKTLYKSLNRKNRSKKPTLKTIQKGKIEKRPALIKKYKCKSCSHCSYQTQKGLALHYIHSHHIEETNMITTKCQNCQVYVVIDIENLKNQSLNLSDVSCSVCQVNEEDEEDVDVETVDTDLQVEECSNTEVENNEMCQEPEIIVRDESEIHVDVSKNVIIKEVQYNEVNINIVMEKSEIIEDYENQVEESNINSHTEVIVEKMEVDQVTEEIIQETEVEISNVNVSIENVTKIVNKPENVVKHVKFIDKSKKLAPEILKTISETTCTELTDDEIESPPYERLSNDFKDKREKINTNLTNNTIEQDTDNSDEKMDFSLVYSSDDDEHNSKSQAPGIENSPGGSSSAIQDNTKVTSQLEENTHLNSIILNKETTVIEGNETLKIELEKMELDSKSTNVSDDSKNMEETENTFEEELDIGIGNADIPYITNCLENPVKFESSFPCLCCDMICKNIRELIEHTKLHNACLSCDIKFHSLASYNQHKTLHKVNEIKYYQCQCNQLISSFESLDTHILKFHSNDINSYYQHFKRNIKPSDIIIKGNVISCIYCINIFDNENDFQNHMQNWHNIQNCKECLKPFHNVQLNSLTQCSKCTYELSKCNNVVQNKSGSETESDDEDIMITNEFLVEKEVPQKVSPLPTKISLSSLKGITHSTKPTIILKSALITPKLANTKPIQKLTFNILKKVVPRKETQPSRGSNVTYVCKKCYKQFNNIIELDSHMNECKLVIHTCQICHKIFQNLCSIQLHIKIEHLRESLLFTGRTDPISKKNTFECETCKYHYPNETVFLKHNEGGKYVKKNLS